MDPMTVKFHLEAIKPPKAKKHNVNSKLAEVLVKLQDRISRVASEAADITEAHETRINALWEDAARQEKLNLSRAQLAAKEYAELKKAVTEGWTKIRLDFQEVVKLNQKLNERIGKAESRIIFLAEALTVATHKANEALEFKRDLRRIVDVQTQEEVRRTSTAPLSGNAQGTSINDLWNYKG
jgi:hypothetical protein